MKLSYAEIKKYSTPEGPYSRYVIHFFSDYLAFLLQDIHPNLITLCSLVSGTAACFFLVSQEHSMLIAGALLVQLSLVFDCFDGMIAKAKKKLSPFGGYFDEFSDIFCETAWHAAIAFYLYSKYYSAPALAAAVLLIAGNTLYNRESDVFKKYFSGQPSIRRESAFRLVINLFGSHDVRIFFILVCCILNILAYFAFFYCVYYNLRLIIKVYRKYQCQALYLRPKSL